MNLEGSKQQDLQNSKLKKLKILSKMSAQSGLFYSTKWLVIIFQLAIYGMLTAQKDSIERRNCQATFIHNEIKIDGKLDESEWQDATVYTDFYQKYPLVIPKANPNTTFKILYDHANIYIGVNCTQKHKNVIQTLKRDQDFFDSDGISILFDPYQNKSAGYLIGCSSTGVQSEAILTSMSLTFEWDAKWTVKTEQHDSGWIAEFKIPFKILKFNTKNVNWGINFVRNLSGISQFHVWNKVPQQFEGTDIGYLGNLEFKELPKSKKTQSNIIPYIKGLYEYPTQEGKAISVGIQTKHSIGTNFNLDLTANPDFSQTELDQQTTNLSRFSIFFPENRTFFIDNSDLFGSYGTGSIKPFFSRTIGLDRNGRTIPIIAGARLTGNINPKLRLGLLNMTTAKTKNTDAANYSAATLYQNLWSRSRVKAIFLNKQNIGDKSEDKYGRNAALEFTYINKDGSILVWSGLSNSFKKYYNHNNYFLLSGIVYNSKHIEAIFDISSVGTNYYTDMGYVLRIDNYDAERDSVIRRGFHQNFQNITYKKYYSEASKFNLAGIYAENFIVFNPDFSFNERRTETGIFLEMKNGNTSNLSLNNEAVNLPYPFKFVNDEQSKNLEAKNYNFSYIDFEYSSSNRNKFNYNLEMSYGGFYNGTKLSTNIGINYRIQPKANFGISYNLDLIKLKEGYGEDQFNRLAIKAEFFLSKKLFFTNFIQYLDQQNRFTFNSKLQWNFAPLSDVFLVFVDDYNTSRFRFGAQNQARNYSIALKLNYWLDL